MGIVITTLLFGIPLLIVLWRALIWFDTRDKRFARESVEWLAIFAALCATTLVLEYPHVAVDAETIGGVHVMSRHADGSTTVRSLLPTWCVGGTKCFLVSTEERRVVSHVKPITSNPKVRDLTYTVQPEVCDRAQFASALLAHNVGADAIDTRGYVRERVRFALYEFNNAHSVELGELYNPIDAVQNRHLRTVLKSAIGPSLAADGLCFDLVSWDVQ